MNDLEQVVTQTDARLAIAENDPDAQAAMESMALSTGVPVDTSQMSEPQLAQYRQAALKKLRHVKSAFFNALRRCDPRHVASLWRRFLAQLASGNLKRWTIAGATVLTLGYGGVHMLNTPPAVDAAAHRPNFVTILIDDMGFSDLGAFGGEVPTPNIDALAAEGLMLTNFYAAPTSTPSRAMLFTGKDYHDVGIGNMPDWYRPEQAGQPGYEGHLTFNHPTYPELLKDNGYHTMLTGKWDLGEQAGNHAINRGFSTARAELIPGGDTHYSQVDGTIITSHHSGRYKHMNRKSMYNENGREMLKFPREFYSTDYYTDMAIEMLNNRPADKPFSLTVCHIATHTPWQAPAEVTAKYLDYYAKGWDVIRQERFERQKKLGLFPANAQLPARNEGVPAWDSLSPEEKRVQAKMMAVYAAMTDVLDQNIGRLVNHLKEIGEYENTVIFLYTDNGAAWSLSAKNSQARWKFIEEHFDNSYENLGNRNSYMGTSTGWGMVSNTPFNFYKGDTYEGGIHVPAIVHYPQAVLKGAKSKRILSAMDITPTMLEMAGIKYPDTYKGVPLSPLDGVSMADLFKGNLDYNPGRWLAWELDGAKGVRLGNWKISQRWIPEKNCWSDTLHLYNLETDPFEREDLAQKEPEKLKELMALYERYAQEHRVIAVGPCPYGDAEGAPRSE